MLIDIVVLVVVLTAAWMGFQRGLAQPLLAELFGLGTLLVILHNRDTFTSVAGALFHANAVLAWFMALILAVVMGYVGARLGGVIRKMPAVQGVDGFLGLWLQALTGVAVCYLLISAVIAMDRAFTPVTTPTVKAAQLQAVESVLRTNPLTAGAVDSRDLQPYEALTSRGAAVNLADLPGIGALVGIDRDVLQPQLAGSHLAPFVMSVGHHIPGLGPYGSRDLPRRG